VLNKSTAGEKKRRHLCELEVVKERDQVADDVEDGVGGGVGGHRRVAVATEVGSQRAEAAGGERGHLVAPREPELREAVDEEDRRRVGGAALGDVEGNAVDVRGPVPHLALADGGGFGIHAFRCSARLTRYLLLLNGCGHFHKYKSSQPPGSFWITCSIVHASIAPSAVWEWGRAGLARPKPIVLRAKRDRARKAQTFFGPCRVSPKCKNSGPARP
jgi:hypothetical protein